jgi:hypothetical protein
VLGVLLLGGVFVYTTDWQAWIRHPSIAPAPPRAQPPAAPATSSVPAGKPAPGKPAPKDTLAHEESRRLVDAYLFFLAVLNSHRARGAMNGSGGLGHDEHRATPTQPVEQ